MQGESRVSKAGEVGGAPRTRGGRPKGTWILTTSSTLGPGNALSLRYDKPLNGMFKVWHSMTVQKCERASNLAGAQRKSWPRGSRAAGGHTQDSAKLWGLPTVQQTPERVARFGHLSGEGTPVIFSERGTTWFRELAWGSPYRPQRGQHLDVWPTEATRGPSVATFLVAIFTEGPQERPLLSLPTELGLRMVGDGRYLRGDPYPPWYGQATQGVLLLSYIPYFTSACFTYTLLTRMTFLHTCPRPS